MAAFLKLSITGEFVDVDQVVLDLKSWRKQTRVRRLGLLLSPEFVECHKVYLDATLVDERRLPELLLRELDMAETLALQDIFYDYEIMDSALSGLLAYQFVWVKKTRLIPHLKKLKHAHIKVSQISIEDMPRLNLLPWRESNRRKFFCIQLLKLFLLPSLIFIVLGSGYLFLQQKSASLSQQIAVYYNQNLHEQQIKRVTLADFASALRLLKQLPAGAVVNNLIYAQHSFSVSGSLNQLKELAALNDVLIQQHWLAAGGGVDVHEQDQAYGWQLSKVSAP